MYQPRTPPQHRVPLHPCLVLRRQVGHHVRAEVVGQTFGLPAEGVHREPKGVGQDSGPETSGPDPS